ncbi:PadR family transcriptional regulator [Croceicoccus marinus]|uniref:PadR family transcriptional regulator n=1 Tax=Croceicoccus marinus TaxID=450378 RepID=A0A7G6VX65_9SPHN|nr:PadR family transcriptional regulator [Croceicoccus marinus]QNE06330.1 PadR family transcriptional regulator [Croceicoccus marinus]
MRNPRRSGRNHETRGQRGDGFGKGFGDEFGDGIPRGRGSRMGRGPGIGALAGDHRARGRGKRMFGHGQLRLVLLELVGRHERHGYELIRAVEALTGGRYAPSPGAVYPTLATLADEGLIAEAEVHSDSARKPFAVTEAGKAHLAGQAEKIAQIFARLKAMDEGDPRGSPPVRRAVGNLLEATRNRAQAAGFTDEVAHRIAAILDEAAGRIERL